MKTEAQIKKEQRAFLPSLITTLVVGPVMLYLSYWVGMTYGWQLGLLAGLASYQQWRIRSVQVVETVEHVWFLNLLSGCFEEVAEGQEEIKNYIDKRC